MSEPGFTYIVIPSLDTSESGRFYAKVFGWVTQGNESHLGFADPGGGMRGAFETGLAISTEPGILPYIYVPDIDQTLDLVTQAGGETVRGRYDEGNLWVATFRDVAGNVIGLWQAQRS